MRDYGKVFSRIWESEDFRSMSEDGRALVLYLLTCQHGTIAGVFRVPDGYACEDLQWSVERVSSAFAETLAKGFANRCETTKWVWVCKFLTWNPPENPNQTKAVRKIAQQIPDNCAWKPAFTRAWGSLLGLAELPESNPSGTLSEGLLNQYQEQEQEQKQEDQKPIRPSPAEPPTDPAQLETKRAERAERLAKVTDDAVAAYNAILAKPKGLLVAVSTKVGKETRRDQVKRCLHVVREICEETTGSAVITPEFWASYFTACGEDDWLRGAGPYTGTHENWRPDFEYLTRKATVLKLYDRASSEDAAA